MRSICLIQLNAAYLHGCHGMRSIMGICGPRESNSLFRNTFLLVVCAVLCCVALTGMHGWLNRSASQIRKIHDGLAKRPVHATSHSFQIFSSRQQKKQILILRDFEGSKGRYRGTEAPPPAPSDQTRAGLARRRARQWCPLPILFPPLPPSSTRLVLASGARLEICPCVVSV
jgi:hypothetical protein